MKNISDWLRSDDDLCIETVNKKYLLPETTLGHKETIDEFLYRVSGGDKEVENTVTFENIGYDLKVTGVKYYYDNTVDYGKIILTEEGFNQI